MSHSTYLFGITFMSRYKVYVWPHDCLSGRDSNVHTNVESIYLACLDLFIPVVVCHAVGSVHGGGVVLFGYEKFVSPHARFSVIANESKI